MIAAALLAQLSGSCAERSWLAGSPSSDRTATTCVLQLGAMPAEGYATHGESWSLPWRCAWRPTTCCAAEGDEPVLILDDVFAELDAKRRERLAELVAPAEQVLVTAAVAGDVPDHCLGRGTALVLGRCAVSDEPSRQPCANRGSDVARALLVRARRWPASARLRRFRRPAARSGDACPKPRARRRGPSSDAAIGIGARPDDRDPQLLAQRDQTPGR